MKKFILILFSFVPTFLQGQPQVFTYGKDGETSLLTSANDTLAFEDYVKTKDANVRLVRLNGTSYKFSIKKTPAGRVQEIKNENGDLLATIPFEGPDRYGIQLSDSTALKWKSIDKYHWTYQKNGVDVMKGSYQKVSGKKQVVLENLDPSVTLPEVVQLSSLERGEHIISSVRPVGMMIGIALGLAVLRVAAASGNGQ